ncbi:MAG: hypothetical protein GY850_21660 [bacterium]|nr:hypothetical protein [bacterium]
MPRFIFGGAANYGQVAGILMLDSTIPRIPGDPGHAETFDFPLLSGFLPANQKIGLITGDTRLLKIPHLEAAGADPARLVIRGMQNSEEFNAVVINRGQKPAIIPESCMKIYVNTKAADSCII